MRSHDWLLSLSIVFSKLLHVEACVSTSFLFVALLFHSTDTPHFILYLSIRQLVGVWVALFSSSMNNAAMNVCVKCLCGCLFSFLLCIPRGGIAGSYGNLRLTLWINTKLFSSEVHPFTFIEVFIIVSEGFVFCISVGLVVMSSLSSLTVFIRIFFLY